MFEKFVNLYRSNLASVFCVRRAVCLGETLEILCATSNARGSTNDAFLAQTTSSVDPATQFQLQMIKKCWFRNAHLELCTTLWEGLEKDQVSLAISRQFLRVKQCKSKKLTEYIPRLQALARVFQCIINRCMTMVNVIKTSIWRAFTLEEGGVISSSVLVSGCFLSRCCVHTLIDLEAVTIVVISES